MANKKEFFTFSWRVTSLHMIAYLIAGLVASSLFHYDDFFSSGALSTLMKPVSSPIVALGPSLQIILGFVLSIILYPFRSIFLSFPKGSLALFGLIAGFSIFTPQVPGPGNYEGLLYTTISISEHLMSIPETLLYSVLFSAALPLWYGHQAKRWTVLSIIAVVLIFLMSFLGYIAAIGLI